MKTNWVEKKLVATVVVFVLLGGLFIYWVYWARPKTTVDVEADILTITNPSVSWEVKEEMEPITRGKLWLVRQPQIGPLEMRMFQPCTIEQSLLRHGDRVRFQYRGINPFKLIDPEPDRAECHLTLTEVR